MFPLGTKPFRHAEKDNEETQLLALRQTIAQPDKSEGNNGATGSVQSSDEQDTLLDNLDEWDFPSRTSPLPPAGEDSDGSNPLDYTSDNEETNLVKDSNDNEEKVLAGDNTTDDEEVFSGNNTTNKEQRDKAQALQEIGAISCTL